MDSWVGLIKRLSSGFLWTGINLLAQVAVDVNLDLGLDVGEPPSEDEILYLERIASNWTSGDTAYLIGLWTDDIYDTNAIMNLIPPGKPFERRPTGGDRTIPELWYPGIAGAFHPIGITFRQMIVAGGDLRYRWRGSLDLPKAEVGFYMERDPGEPLIGDRGSFYYARDFGKDRLIMGDHQVVFGYGLLLWRVYGVNKGFGTVSALPRLGAGIAPYRSSHESWPFRGLAYTRRSSYGDWTLSIGQNPWDGSIDSLGTVTRQHLGLHDTKSRQEMKDRLTEQSLVGIWTIKRNGIRLGAAALAGQWSGPGVKEHPFKGSSVYYSLGEKPVRFFGEISSGVNSSIGVLTGVVIRKKPLQYLISLRSYRKGYQGLRSNPFGEWRGDDRNEDGVYQGMHLQSGDHNLRVYGDLYQQNGADPGKRFPRKGQETAIQWKWRKPSHVIKVQWKRELKTRERGGLTFDMTESSKDLVRSLKIFLRLTGNKGSHTSLQLSMTNVSDDQSVSRGWGFNLRSSRKVLKSTILVDWVTTGPRSSRGDIYFWDVNLPTEMRSHRYTGSGHSPGLQFRFQGEHGFQAAVRCRGLWEDLAFNAPPRYEGALSVSIQR